ncbi:MAG: T7SS effector LXG polymorphic toxin [Sporolactobacillus sp.]
MRAVMGSSGTAANTIRYDAKALIQAAEARAKQYQTLDEEMRQLKQSFAQITVLGSSFKGRGAEKIKAFYQAQETVVNAWLRLIEKQVAFLNGIAGEIDDRNLGGATQVQIPFLESDLSIAYWRSRDVVNDQKESINKVLNSISDLIPVGKLNTEEVKRQLDKANRAQAKMSEDVRDLDRTLLNEYQQVISDVPQIVSLYSALEHATRQGTVWSRSILMPKPFTIVRLTKSMVISKNRQQIIWPSKSGRNKRARCRKKKKRPSIDPGMRKQNSRKQIIFMVRCMLVFTWVSMIRLRIPWSICGK